MNASAHTPPGPRNVLSLPTPLARGFTLFELLVAVTIAAVLLALAAPSLADVARSIKISSASNVFLSSLHLTRSESIKRSGRVVMCKSPDGLFCSATGDWAQGWIIFHDLDNNGVRNGLETIIRREMALESSLRLVGNLNVARYVSFTPSGATKLVGGGFQAGTLTVCHYSAGPGAARQIVLNAAGRPRVQKVAVSTCG
jgi:type IV fimbrial biogenesis protein FimT